MLTIIAFILTIGLVVTVHEYGHYQVAKWCGVRVLKFSIGFGHPLIVKKIGQDQTEFAISAIPLGGYVKMLDEREIASDTQINFTEIELKRAFNRQSVFKRMAIVLAGPMANLLMAVILYWLLFMMGVVGMRPILGPIIDQSPAASASFAFGETIQKINGKNVVSWQEVRWLLLNESLKKNNVIVQGVSNNQQIHLHQLDLSAINFDDVDQDILSKVGFTIYQPVISSRIGEVIKNGPADLAGLRTNDLVLVANQVKVENWDDFVREVRMHPNVSLNVLVRRDGSELMLNVKPEAVLDHGKTIGRIGAGFSVEQSGFEKMMVTQHYSVTGAFIKAIEKTWDTATFSLKMLGKMVLGQISWKGMSGPVTIANYAGQSANIGVKAFISFLALISISIGVLNLLPIPVLDGGHFMYYMVEIFTGKPVSEDVMMIGQKIGFSILGFIMILALYNDMNRLISG